MTVLLLEFVGLLCRRERLVATNDQVVSDLQTTAILYLCLYVVTYIFLVFQTKHFVCGVLHSELLE